MAVESNRILLLGALPKKRVEPARQDISNHTCSQCMLGGSTRTPVAWKQPIFRANHAESPPGNRTRESPLGPGQPPSPIAWAQYTAIHVARDPHLRPIARSDTVWSLAREYLLRC